MISSTIFLAAVLNAEELNAPALSDTETDSSEAELVERELTDERRLTSGPGIPWHWWECNNGHEWIKSKYVCDGACDCTDCSDEWSGSGTVSDCPYTNADPLPWSAARAAARGEIEERRLEQTEQRRLIPGQCRCTNGSTGMLTGQGCLDRSSRQRCDQAPAGQCTCSNGSTGMVTADGCLDRRTRQRCDQMPGQCTCSNGSTGMLTDMGCLDRRTNQRCDQMAGQCTCSDGSTGMRTGLGCLDRRTRQNCDLMPGQCNCSDGTTGFIASGGDCVCDETRLFGR